MKPDASETQGRLWAYARVSSDGQADNTSLDVQAERIRAWAVSQGLRVEGLFSDVATGSSLDRPELSELRRVVRSGDAVVVLKLDRLSRSILDAEPLISDWEKCGVALFSVTEPVETHSAMGRAALRMILVFAQAEREVIGERMAAGKAKNAADGRFNGSPVPFGFRRGADGERDFEVIEAQAAIVRDLFHQFASGKVGVRRLRAYTGCPLSEPAISALLSNPFYTGRIRYEGQVRFHDHERLVSDRLFNRAQRAKARRAKGRAAKLWKVVENKGEMVPLS